jgi:hypothetical protein
MTNYNPKTLPECVPPLVAAGIDQHDAMKLRTIATQLHRWHEMECGTERGAIERDEQTGELRWYDNKTHTWGPYHGRDTETLAKCRLREIMAKYPTLQAYIQGDPRGASLYILRPGDVPEGQPADAYYSRGLAVYR